MRRRFYLPGLLLLLLALAGCAELDRLRVELAGTPHDGYADALRQMGLDRSAAGAAWLAAAGAALDAPHTVALPFREVAYFDPAEPRAVAYRFEVRGGERVRISVRPEAGDSARVFVDLFDAPGGQEAAPRRVAGTEARADTAALAADAARDRIFLLRVQPELLHGGRVIVEVETGPSLDFPVAGVDARAIRSVFGDPRDGGRRQHEGVDIFAPRGTPALAAASGTVTRVAEGGLGGKTVWIRPDGRALGLYYAHLDEQLVVPGQRVATGDTLGLVGNTGNAIRTQPHLHFGVYASGLAGRGAVDPMPFIDDRRPALPAVQAPQERLGEWVRLGRSAPLAEGTASRAETPLPAGTALRVVGASGDGYRVETPEGAVGVIAARQVEAAAPAAPLAVREGQVLRARSASGAAAVDSLAAGAVVRELGRSEAFRLVETESGRRGWLPLAEGSRQ